MITREAPNGTLIEFPDGTPEETIQEYLSPSEYQLPKEIEDKIWEIESRYPKHQHIDLDKDLYHPYDRNNLLRLYTLKNKRLAEEKEMEKNND